MRKQLLAQNLVHQSPDVYDQFHQGVIYEK